MKSFGEGFGESKEGGIPPSVLVEAFKEVNKFNQLDAHPVGVEEVARDTKEARIHAGEKTIKQALESTSFEEIRDKYEIQLRAAGIDLVPGGGGEDEPTFALMQVGTFAPKFAQYLRENIDSGNVTNNYDLVVLLRRLAEQVNGELIRYGLDISEQGKLIDRASGLDEMVDEYKRLDSKNELGIFTEAEHMQKLLGWQKENTLKEHLLFENYGLDVRPKVRRTMSGPWSWHRERMPEHEVAIRWADITDVLRILKPVPELFSRALETLKTENSSAQADIEVFLESSGERVSDQMKMYAKSLLKILKEAYAVLREIELED